MFQINSIKFFLKCNVFIISGIIYLFWDLKIKLEKVIVVAISKGLSNYSWWAKLDIFDDDDDDNGDDVARSLWLLQNN